MKRPLNNHQFDPFDAESMEEAYYYGEGVQLPMFARAGDLRQHVMDKRLPSVDTGTNAEDWDEEKTVSRRGGLAKSIAAEGVKTPVIMVSVTESALGNSNPPGSVYLGNGNHRVATAGKHFPDTEVPIYWSEDEGRVMDYMGPQEWWD